MAERRATGAIDPHQLMEALVAQFARPESDGESLYGSDEVKNTLPVIQSSQPAEGAYFTREHIDMLKDILRPPVVYVDNGTNGIPHVPVAKERHTVRNFMIGALAVVALAGAAAGFLVKKGKDADRPATEEGVAQLLDYDAAREVFIPRESPEVHFEFVGAYEPSVGRPASIVFEIELIDQGGKEVSLTSLTTRPEAGGEPEQTVCEIAKMVYRDMLDVSTIRDGVAISLVERSDNNVHTEVFSFSVGREGCLDE